MALTTASRPWSSKEKFLSDNSVKFRNFASAAQSFIVVQSSASVVRFGACRATSATTSSASSPQLSRDSTSNLVEAPAATASATAATAELRGSGGIQRWTVRTRQLSRPKKLYNSRANMDASGGRRSSCSACKLGRCMSGRSNLALGPRAVDGSAKNVKRVTMLRKASRHLRHTSASGCARIRSPADTHCRSRSPPAGVRVPTACSSTRSRSSRGRLSICVGRSRRLFLSVIPHEVSHGTRRKVCCFGSRGSGIARLQRVIFEQKNKKWYVKLSRCARAKEMAQKA